MAKKAKKSAVRGGGTAVAKRGTGKKAAKKTAVRAGRKAAARNGVAVNGATARKATTKTAKKAGTKVGKKVGKKGAGKKAGAKKASLAPKPVKTGRGASPAVVGAGVVEMVRARTPEREIWAKWFSPNFVSIEGSMGQAWHGRAAAQSKADWWLSTHKIHSLEADGPYLGATGFGVRYSMDVEDTSTGARWKGDELAFYTVKNGKVVQEEFMGKPM